MGWTLFAKATAQHRVEVRTQIDDFINETMRIHEIPGLEMDRLGIEL